jgi:transcriptional regulator, RpiR family
MLLNSEPITSIESNLEKMTNTEKEIAYHFLKNREITSIKANFFCKELHVSKASLTRFSKKCGFKGFRDFLYQYQIMVENQKRSSGYKDWTQNVLSDYEEILQKNYSVLDEKKLDRIKKMIESASKIYFYGKGSSALALSELKMRFMRLGIMGEMIDDDDMIIWNSLLVDDSSLIIGASISGKTKCVIKGLASAKEKGAKTILMTTRNFDKHDFCDELVLLPSTENLSYGNKISPQFPILLMTDCLFSFFLDDDERRFYYDRTIIHKEG